MKKEFNKMRLKKLFKNISYLFLHKKNAHNKKHINATQKLIANYLLLAKLQINK